MKRGLFMICMLGLAISAMAQKSRVISVMQMIDARKYKEAKEAIELAVWNDRTSGWHRTYYAKALLCQNAWEEGTKNQDGKLTGLYEDQLFVAYASYEKAVELDVNGRNHSAVGQKYYTLSNDFRTLGLERYAKRDFEGALRAFEHALLLVNSDLLNVAFDTSLVYNTAMLAYESKNWEKAIGYLDGLHDDAYDPNASLLLVDAHLRNGDTLQAEEVMMEGIKSYDHSDTLVMYLVNWLVKTDRKERAIEILDEAIRAHPDHFRFHWARGLVYRRMDRYTEAIESFKEADELTSDPPAELYYHIGVCYYNLGIDMREAALAIPENDEYLRVRDQYLARFREAVIWLEKSYELDPSSEDTITKLSQLYYQLQMKEKQEAFEELLH